MRAAHDRDATVAPRPVSTRMEEIVDLGQASIDSDHGRASLVEQVLA
jgi:hypothetical protein